MKPITDAGKVLEAEFSVAEAEGQTTVVLESRSGDGRNPDYHPALELLLARLRDMGAVVTLVIVDSTVSRGHPFDDRVLDIRQRPYPIELAQEDDVPALRIAIGAAQQVVAQRPGARGGNRHKRIRLYLEGVDAAGLETRLAGGGLESGDVAEVLDAIERVARPKTGGGQGRGLNAAQRRAVEERAVTVVTRRLRKEGWEVDDVARENRGYDLHASRAKEEIHVEVKGTTGVGAGVLLTRNEVRHAREHAAEAVLAVVAGIRLANKGDSWEGDGGTDRVFDRWRLEDGVLEPVGYEWVLPPSPGPRLDR